MVPLLKIKDLQEITGGWVCRCSRYNGRYVYMSEDSCIKTCCKDASVDYHHFGVNYKPNEVIFCSEEARITVQKILKEMALMQESKINNFEISDSYDVII